MTNQRIVLAFNGRPASCAAAKWLADQVRVTSCAEAPEVKKADTPSEVIALVVDVGQGEDPEETRGRALACGAPRVHVVERLDQFARRAIIPAAAVDEALDDRALRRLPYPVIATALVEVAAIEKADAVAHGSADEALDAEIHALAPHLRVIAPAREEHARQITASPALAHPDRHLLMRSRVSPAAAGSTATVTIAFDAGIPVSVNGVVMALPELIESLSLLGGQYRMHESNKTPALTLLQGAYRVSKGQGSVTLQLQAGTLVVVSAETTSGPADDLRQGSHLRAERSGGQAGGRHHGSELVNHA